jgi:hypothetical protein
VGDILLFSREDRAEAISIKSARSLFLRSKQGAFCVEICCFYTVLFQKWSLLRAFGSILFLELAEMIERQNTESRSQPPSLEASASRGIQKKRLTAEEF